MRIPEYAQQHKVAFNMTPMIDVVFLLVIFFLVSSHLARQETQAALELPAMATALDDEETSATRVTLNVLPSGETLLGAEPVDAAAITRRLAAERGRHIDSLEVRIRADRGVPYGAVEPVLAACAKAGVWDVKFAVTERIGSPASLSKESP